VGNRLIDEIIANFGLQYELCQNMEQESRQQLESLQMGTGRAEINPILDRRRLLLLKLDQLCQDNRKLQQELSRELGLEEFNLTRLKPCLAAEEWAVLAKLINQLSLVLRRITDTDARSQQLMSLGQAAAPQKAGPINQNQALRAYQEVIRQNKEPRS
jgi:flagellar biosynthesis/type III secretory pathway chaperone